MQFAELNPKMMKIQEIDVTNLQALIDLANTRKELERYMLKTKINNSTRAKSIQGCIDEVEQEFKNLLDISNKSM